ncbi:MAG: ATP-dependent protease ATPase subunit HslU [Candidatus Aminicenantes bacterium]|nr:ATP-dependent protease ATPase subunit HslU [Candidatus Aminicenantes bacterium]NIM78968.1 ATP-dependent protease ATPase subunit HslU [Candidatus Aminicenantes bacterium]NIN18227.1 ATP-dependent protease ATPase subunit HslU [Candidatus Aminicenantes bacterium]NIN42124.1 ATP-dependent protease ATPase subunit HslU [Candidatus Aminicenantes bacterium]NIN84880.1 ATP-dependent protease ATPase subunit HslU [Candidatus Aminicenantes bacterium]
MNEKTTTKKDSTNLTPKEIVKELDYYIIGQHKAKRSVAIALRNRYRRQQLPKEIADDIIPKNILMIGPTGVGKTEIARRLAKLAGSPFIKVEASKFTEVGYVGRDVESMVRDLVRIAIDMVKEEKMEANKEKAKRLAEDRILDILLPTPKKPRGPAAELDIEEPGKEKFAETKEKLRKKLREGKLNDNIVEIEVKSSQMAPFEIFSSSGVEEIGISISEMVPNMLGGGKPKKRKMHVEEAVEYIIKEEQNRLLDMDQIASIAIERVEQMGIIFLDEVDKIAGREVGGHGPSVSREGVQRDLLPIIEGTTVNTRYGMVKTDHILFIGAGAFHVSKPSDLIPELQGRFPIRVELDSLSKSDFIRILTEPKNALVKQTQALLSTEGLEVVYTQDAIEEVARLSEHINATSENIGARRLYTLMEKVIEEISFDASDIGKGKVKIDKAYVLDKVEDIVQDTDLSKYIL